MGNAKTRLGDCSLCGRQCHLAAKNLCHACYRRNLRAGGAVILTCTGCKRPKRQLKAAGLCATCYCHGGGYLQPLHLVERLQETTGPHGLPLATLALSASQEEEERAYRTAIYAAQIQRDGVLRWGELGERSTAETPQRVQECCDDDE